MINATVNMGIQIPIPAPAFNYFDYLPRSAIAERYGNSVFDFVKNHCTVFHRSCTILHSHQQYTSFYLVHTLNNTCYFLLLFALCVGNLNGCEAVSHCAFDFHFPTE